MPAPMPPVPPVEQRQPSLTELAAGQALMCKQLIAFTDARAYLIKVIQGEVELPTLHVTPPMASNDNPGGASLDMRTLPDPAIETILSSMIEHVERSACETWKRLQMNSNVACTLITQLQAQQAVQLKKQQEEEGFPPTIPINQPPPQA